MLAKRFVDTKIWDKQWFRKLRLKQKLLWLYIVTKCDHAGIWDADFEAASFFIGEEVSIKDLDFMSNKVIKVKTKSESEQLFIPDFIEYQYGKLSSTSKPHISVSKRLESKGLKKYLKGLETLKEKEKDKDEDKIERVAKFKSQVSDTAQELSMTPKMAREFFDYWSEMKPNGRKMKFEFQQTFDIKRRLIKWRNNNNEWATTRTNNKYKRQTLQT